MALGGCVIEPDSDGGTTSGDTVDPAGSEDDADGSESGPASGAESDGETGSSSGSSSGSGSETGADVDATQRCDAFCERWLAAGCDEDWTMGGCMLTCESLTSADACNASANTYLDCAEDTTIECDAAGTTYAVGCGLQWLDAIECAVTESPNPAIVEPCAEYCGNVQAAGCPANGPESDCNIACLWSGNTGVGCDTEWGGIPGLRERGGLVVPPGVRGRRRLW